MTTREILDAAGQRNVSAIGYHFGSREGLLLEILSRRGAVVDEGRAAALAALGADPHLAGLVGCLVRPYAEMLHRPPGRSYVRIVAQLRGRFAAWRVESDVGTTAALSEILDRIERVSAGDEPERQLRVVGMIMLLTSMIAERASLIDAGALGLPPHDEFCATLELMCVGVLTAPDANNATPALGCET